MISLDEKHFHLLRLINTLYLIFLQKSISFARAETPETVFSSFGNLSELPETIFLPFGNLSDPHCPQSP